MPRSMTGFGRAQARSEHYALRAELRSVNNRNLRVVFRIPELFQSLETELNIVRETVIRGTVTATFVLDDLTGDPGYVLDEQIIRYYRDALRHVEEDAQIPLAALVTLPGVVRRKTADEAPEELADIAVSTLRQALAALAAARETEGRFIWKEMLSRCAAIREWVSRIEARVPLMVDEYRGRLAERLGRLLEGAAAELTQDDLRKEIALFADRSDVSEEITRLRSHLELMERMGNSQTPIGRKLEFVTQEMFREANTVASKSSDSDMVHTALEIKAEIEKLREQALNIE